MNSINSTDWQHLQQDWLSAPRPDITVVRASGDRIRDYLQGQLTQDIKRLTTDTGIYACVLSPQGKAVSDVRIIAVSDDELLLLAPTAYTEALLARLRRFSLGFKLSLETAPDLAVISLQGTGCDQALQQAGLPVPATTYMASCREASGNCFVLRLPEASDQGVWIIGNAVQCEATLKQLGNVIAPEAMEAASVIHGTPRFGRDWDDGTYPLNANFIEYDGVSFDKGCYVGQEITSRMRWRGGIKKKLYRVQLPAMPESQPCPVRTTVDIGSLTAASTTPEGQSFGIAVLPIEVVEKESSLSIEGIGPIQLLEPCHA